MTERVGAIEWKWEEESGSKYESSEVLGPKSKRVAKRMR
jgi:hypothetical protein